MLQRRFCAGWRPSQAQARGSGPKGSTNALGLAALSENPSDNLTHDALNSVSGLSKAFVIAVMPARHVRDGRCRDLDSEAVEYDEGDGVRFRLALVIGNSPVVVRSVGLAVGELVRADTCSLDVERDGLHPHEPPVEVGPALSSAVYGPWLVVVEGEPLSVDQAPQSELEVRGCHGGPELAMVSDKAREHVPPSIGCCQAVHERPYFHGRRAYAGTSCRSSQSGLRSLLANGTS